MDSLFGSTALRRTGLVASVFLAIWSVKLWAIGRYGSDLPYWDQWAKEGELFYAPWFQHHAFWHNLFVPHNEHRIAPTLAMNLGLLELSGDQWDARVQCVASAALHALLIAGLAGWALKRFRRGWALAGCALLVLIAAPPIAWENILGGFQSQFYFLAIFSIVAIARMLGSAAFSPGWFLGIASAAVACVSMGSGMLAAAPVAVVAAMRILRHQKSMNGRRLRDAVATLVAALLIGGIGWYYRPHAPWEDSIHTQSVWETIVYAARCLAWPLYGTPWLAVVFWAPWVVLAAAFLRAMWAGCPQPAGHGEPELSRGEGTPPTSNAPASDQASGADGAAPSNGQWLSADFIVAGGLWVLAQIAAVTYSRAGGSVLPASRYGDICALGLAFNFFALAWMADRARAPRCCERARVESAVPSSAPAQPLARARSPEAPLNHGEGGGRRTLTPWVAVAGIWLLAVASAITISTRTELQTDLPQKRSDNAAYIRNTQAFVLTDDYATFAKEVPLIPFPMADWLARILRNPTLRPLLPESVRPPIPVPGLADYARNPAPPLLHRATRTITAGQHWQSPPLPAAHGWWKIETAGDCGQPGAVLELVGVADHRVLGVIAPSKPAGNSWRAAYVRAPAEPVMIEARVSSPAHWLAFSDPIAMSSLSHWAWRLTLNAWWLALVAGIGLLGFGAALWVSERFSTGR